MKVFKFYSVLLAALALVVSTNHNIVMAEDGSHVKKIDFLMAHKPDNPDNVQLIKDFAKRVRDKTGGKIDITPVDMSGREGGLHTLAIRSMYLGEEVMSQVSIKRLPQLGFSDDIEVLDMPLLFRDHDHASKVLDGKIGKDLMDTVLTGSNGRIKGLAFTYSGGFRNFYSSLPLESVADMKDKKMRLLAGRMSRDLVDNLGVSFTYAVPETSAWIEGHKSGEIEVDESEIIRLSRYQRGSPDMFKSIKTVLETNHNLFLTLVTINAPLYNSLTEEQRQIIQQEADVLAVQERELSIQQEKDGKKDFVAKGITIVPMSDADRKTLEAASDKVHAKHKAHLGKWVSAIRAVK